MELHLKLSLPNYKSPILVGREWTKGSVLVRFMERLQKLGGDL